MNIITRIPAAYFIHLPGNEEIIRRWINLASVTTVDYHKSTLVVYFIDKTRLVLEDDRALHFLEELEKLNQKYGS